MKKYPNCVYNENGCSTPRGCDRCGFDRQEARRRKRMPLVLDGETGLLRKRVDMRKEN